MLKLQRQQRMDNESATYYSRKILSKYFINWYTKMRLQRDKRYLSNENFH